ncbi:hypothetical protein H072_9046 [Dactylellina haptotyla CBS 200.50]|uniref:Uncharacterized protein n=1 Tax=Dactylellina haptotyla (strain CBS 200.50) TaxID=1284197 RepID=S8BPS9_DACHA|nr:hypothetical protein H072_9046 [Dactylellina haptotyla CBS 200.50]
MSQFPDTDSGCFQLHDGQPEDRYVYVLGDDYYRQHIDPELQSIKYEPSIDQEETDQILFIQQRCNHVTIPAPKCTDFDGVPTGWIQFKCSKCSALSPPFHQMRDSGVQLNFQLDELSPDDLLLCKMCHTNDFLGLEKCRIHDIFQPTLHFPKKSMIRVLALKSTQNGVLQDWQSSNYDPEKDSRHQIDNNVRWIPPVFPFVWPLWSLENPIRCLLCPKEKNHTCKKRSDYVDHLSSELGRYRCTICVDSPFRFHKAKNLPAHLFARHDDAKKHIERKTHPQIKGTNAKHVIVLNDQEVVSQLGRAFMRKNWSQFPNGVATYPEDLYLDLKSPEHGCPQNRCFCESYDYENQVWTKGYDTPYTQQPFQS